MKIVSKSLFSSLREDLLRDSSNIVLSKYKCSVILITIAFVLFGCTLEEDSVTNLSGATKMCPVAAVSGGVVNTCILLSDGSVKCWGRNNAGQLGDGTTTDRYGPITVSGISNATAITSHEHTCALLSDKTIKCWGDNQGGQLGDGTTTNRSLPTTVSGISNAISVSAGQKFTCALIEGGSIKCWGNNGRGQLGNGTNTDSTTPVSVTGISNAVSIDAGSAQICAVLSDNTVKCWGRNTRGSLGDGTTTDRSTPVTVSGISNATMVSTATTNLGAADPHTCALLTDKTIKCWGSNGVGQLGDGTTTTRTTPVTLSGISNATAVSAGSLYTCALLNNGTIKCLGDNQYGQLGDGTTTTRTTPVTVSGISNATSIMINNAGGVHHCALLSDGSVKCWGRNLFGEIGDGTTTQRSTPVTVQF